MKKKSKPTEINGVPVESLESLARVLYEPIRDYLSSEQGKKDYAEWEKERQKERQKDNNDLRNV